jgi:hypothetical protein
VHIVQWTCGNATSPLSSEDQPRRAHDYAATQQRISHSSMCVRNTFQSLTPCVGVGGCSGGLVSKSTVPLTGGVVYCTRLGRMAFAFTPYRRWVRRQAAPADSAQPPAERGRTGCRPGRPKVSSVRAPSAAQLARTAAERAMRGAALAGALPERLRYSGPAPCPLCAADGKRRTQDATFHLYCECTHPAVQAEREALHLTR